MRPKYLSLLICISFLLMTGMIGCGKPYAKAYFQTAERLNPDDQGRALSVVIRIYQLKNKQNLENADFYRLWSNEAEVLEGDILDKEELTLYPDSENMFKITRKPEANYIGIVAFFRKPVGNSWRAILPLKKKREKIYLTLGEQGIKATKSKKEWK